MNQERFLMLLDIMKVLMDEDISKTEIEKNIVKLIDKFDSVFSQSQKNEILQEFIAYERKKNGRNEMERIKKLTESFEYSRNLERFSNTSIF